MSTLRPADPVQLQEAVASALASQQSLELVAGGTKRTFGRPVRADHVLDLGAFSGLVDYDPSELVLTARPSTPMKMLEKQLRSHGQMLAFEPPDWRDLLSTAGEPTLGGTIACNMAGPRRIRAGAARDHFLGFSAVNGRGEIWKAGGRVVKNVTGYDMCKLQAGAFGTLSVLTEVTVRVLPRPETSCTLVRRGLDDAHAILALADALNSPHEVSAAAHLPAAAAARSGAAAMVAGRAATLVRLEGPRPSVTFRAAALEGVLGPLERMEHDASVALWAAIGGVQPLLAAEAGLVWRLCPPPAAAPTVFQELSGRLPSAAGFYDWGGGLLWVSLDPEEAGPDGGAAAVRAVMTAGGHATLIRAPETVREAVPVFPPVQPALGALTRRIKEGFDPAYLLNPGRMHEGA